MALDGPGAGVVDPGWRKDEHAGWHSVDLAEVLAAPGDTMTVALAGWHISIVREGEGDSDLRAFHRSSGRPVRCVVRAGVIFVNLAADPASKDDALETNTTPHCA